MIESRAMDSGVRADELGKLFTSLRAIAQDFNLGCFTSCQVNRAGNDKRDISMKDVAKSFEIFFPCDMVLTFNQTKEERKVGRARIMMEKGGWPTFTFFVKVGTTRSDVTAFLCAHG
jgi:hypothetical protein